ncbi:VCBS repeat-containing protein [Spongiimicrobium sp. 3-5]|uniref:VCBS repeat-containing protein n=1 Tax=Spongiimicrobium sp. 3-5 TaxID=3332596 RepID=UPI0039807F92
MGKYSCLILCILFIYACSKGDKAFQNLPNSSTGIDFSNDLSWDEDLHILNYIYYFNGGGVAAGDINNDGLVDLYFTGNQVSSRLYLNKGDLQFKDITETSNTKTTAWASGATMVDINADGWLDIYVSISGSRTPEGRENQLFINQKDGTFKEMAKNYGLADKSYATQAAFFDYDLDGDLDMYLLNHMHGFEGLNTPKVKKVNGEAENTDKLYRNEGLGQKGHPVFKDVSQQAGIVIEGFGLGVGISDVNEDGYPDIYVSNDFVSNDILYINQGDGSFKNEIASFLNHQSHNGMGNDVADINNDGLADILVMDMLPSTNEKRKNMLNKPNYDLFAYSSYLGYEPQYMRNTLQLNRGSENGKTYFGEIGQLSGISSTDWSWAPLLADYDLDGQKDIYITNGYLKDMTNLDFIVYRKRTSIFATAQKADSIYLASIKKLPEVKTQNYFFKNNGDLTFNDVSSDWTKDSPTFSNGAVYADLDNDGDLDIVTNNINEKATILKNTAIEKQTENKYLGIRFKGSRNNGFGIGAKVWVYTNNGVQFMENYVSRGFQSSVPPQLNFGFSKDTEVDSVKVIWPDGKSKVVGNIVLDEVTTLTYSDSEVVPVNADSKEPLFSEVLGETDIPFRHQELVFTDFNREPLIPSGYANNGPSVSVADINGDRLDDFYVGGSNTFPGNLFVQKTDGTFDTIPMPFDEKYEDLGAVFFDADNDGDQDLYVVSGGSEFLDKAYYQDRLYHNNGKGKFSQSKNALPTITSSGSCAVVSDYDQDGDLDVFVGGRVVPGDYGAIPKSYLLNNENGVFKDVTASVMGANEIGMVSSALWTDFDNDGWTDLIVVGEWMPITIFKNSKGILSKKIELKGTKGWWNSINGGDFDNDGDTDYVLGNLGTNSFFKASQDLPMTLTLGDFDKDKKNDPILSTYSKDSDGEYRSYPFVSRDLLADQMVLIKNKYRTYKQYATAQVKDIASEDAEFITLECNNLNSIYLENLGNNEFKPQNLPQEAQFAPIMGTSIKDYDLDGNLDVLLIGNFYHAEVGYGQYDASLGLFLKGNGKGKFEAQNFRDSGFVVAGDSRALVQLTTAKGNLILAARNDDTIKVFEQNGPKGKTIALDRETTHAIITSKEGTKQKVEFYCGEGYLSQSSRSITIPNEATIQQFN